MHTISMLDLRRDAERIVRRIQAGERLLLTYRGQPVARLEPVADTPVGADDPFYRLPRLATDDGEPLSNPAIDDLLYGA